MEKTKQELLAEAQLLAQRNGLNPSTGRKVRSDKGKKRLDKDARPNLYKRDKSSPTATASKMDIYKRVLGKVLKKDQTRIANNEVPFFAGYDHHGYYIVIEPQYVTEAQHYEQTHKGRKIVHELRRKCIQKRLDLEQHRFEAWQEMATNHETRDTVVPVCPELRVMLYERYGLTPQEANFAIEKRQITWYLLFQEFYFVEEQDIGTWDYKLWREHYDRVPKELLPEDFRFSLKYKPGTPEFHPEWAYRVAKLEALTQEAREQEKERKRSQFLTNLGKKHPMDKKMTEQELIEAAIFYNSKED